MKILLKKMKKKKRSNNIMNTINNKSITPLLAVDGIVEFRDGIVLIERKNEPFGWALQVVL